GRRKRERRSRALSNLNKTSFGSQYTQYTACVPWYVSVKSARYAEERMPRVFATVFVVTLCIIAAAAPSSHSAVRTSHSAGSFSPRRVVNQYCIFCHSKELKTAGVVLEGLDFSQVGPNAPLLERVF